jgi:hypothetical protein
LLATDYPHPGTPVDPAAAWEAELDKLPDHDAQALLGANASRLTTTPATEPLTRNGDH